jgi:flagellar P-ring protein precursor FlgI
VVGGYSLGSATNSKPVNHPTVGRIPNGGLIERDSSIDLAKLQHVSLLMNEASFTTVEEVASVVNQELATPAATVIDSRRVEIQMPVPGNANVPALLARIENLEIRVRRKAKVVVNERTGTVVMGQDVRLGAVSILHGSFSIEVITTYGVATARAGGRGDRSGAGNQGKDGGDSGAQCRVAGGRERRGIGDAPAGHWGDGARCNLDPAGD